MGETLTATPEQKAAHFRHTAEKIAAYINAQRAEKGQGPMRELPPAAMVQAVDEYVAREAGVEQTWREMIEAISVVKQKAAKGQAKAPRAPGRFSHQPTPEREAKAVNGIRKETVVPAAGPVMATTSHTVLDYVGRNREEFTVAEMQAIEWIRDLAEAYCNVRMTTNWDSSGGGVAGSRVGGLGNVSEEMRAKHTAYEFIRRKMPPEFVATVEALLVQLRFEDRNVSPAEFAAKLFPSHRDKSFRSGVSLTAAKYTAILVAWIYVREVALTRPPRPPRRVLSIMTEPAQ